MKWNLKESGFIKRFAFLPICAGSECVWLQFYWVRHMGLYNEVSFENPELLTPPTKV